MTQWIGDKWRLKAGPQLGPTNSNESAEGTTTGNNPEPRRCGYKESFVQEYDGIKVYHHQGSYQHLGPHRSILGLSMNIEWLSTRSVGTSLLMRT